MPPPWLVAVAWCSLALGFGSAGWIVFDVYGRGRRQRMAVMEAVWPLTALYLGPVAVWAYRRLGRAGMPGHGHGRAPTRRSRWSGIALSVTHCGAGCVLGDVIAEFVLFGIAASIAGQALYAEYIGDYVLAIAFGIVFQYLVISRMRRLTVREGLLAAAKSDVIALSAFEIGLFGWMALMRFAFFPRPDLLPDSPVYWLFMQLGMILGFVTSWPANLWLIRRGIKEAM
jgi:Domain of unknown function (DUF4396)